MMSRRSATHRQRGFTLAEILVTTAVFAVIMIAALAIYDRSNQVFKQSTEAADLQQSTRVAFEKLISDVRMAGFDYSRGGTPTGDNQYAQPDEQIEYAGTSAIAFRANFDYNSDAVHDNGRENASGYEPTNGAFPYVTTGNDEIVIYALRSTDKTKNTDSITMNLDSAKPRKAYPGGGKETVLTIDSSVCSDCGVDLSNKNPPYTLYRMTVDDVINKKPGSAIAENIRSLKFFYYTDTAGQTLLKKADGTVLTQGAIGGDGLYDPSSVGTTPNFDDRSQRASITSVRVELVGMSANTDAAYQNPAETDTTLSNINTLKKYRTYTLSSLVVPRNLGLTGLPEPDLFPPGAPTITGGCTGSCGAPKVWWSKPNGGGVPAQYAVQWDTNQSGTFNSKLYVSASELSVTIPYDPTISLTAPLYVQIVAINDNGSSTPSNTYSLTPNNSTKPGPVGGLHATDQSDSTAVNDNINLTWTAPTANASGSLTCTGSGTSGGGNPAPLDIPQELIRYRVLRGTTATFKQAEGVVVLDNSATSQPANSAPGSSAAWIDGYGTSAAPPAPCTQYYYRVQAFDQCNLSDAANVSKDHTDGESTWYPDFGTNAIPGYAKSSSTPGQPIGLKIDTANTTCTLVSTSPCNIGLSWSKVTTDTNVKPIVVDSYVISRQRKKLSDASFKTDPSYSPITVSGQSQTSSGTVTYVNTSVTPRDSADFLPWYYQYTVAAVVCGNQGADSSPVIYPSNCSLNPTVTATGSLSGDGQTPSTPWIMDNTGVLTVTPASGKTIVAVKFDVYDYKTGSLVVSATDSSSPFTFTWPGETDGSVYTVVMTATDNSTPACQEVMSRYVEDQPAAACFFDNVTKPSQSDSGNNTRTVVDTFSSIPNNGSEAITLKSVKVTFRDPDGLHPDMKLYSVIWQVGSSTSATDSFTGTTFGTVTRTAPGSISSAPVPKSGTTGANFGLRFTFQYNGKNNGGDPDLGTSAIPITKVCVDYTIASESGVTKHCNLMGQAASTANPGSCD